MSEYVSKWERSMRDQMSTLLDCKNPYKSPATEAYVTGVNILAVEYLIKKNDRDTYGKYIDILYSLSVTNLEHLQFLLSFNAHTSSLGAMITQGDYDRQVIELIGFLDAANEDNNNETEDGSETIKRKLNYKNYQHDYNVRVTKPKNKN